MNTITVLFVVLLCLVIVNARRFEERIDDLSADNDQSDNIRRQREHGAGQMRRRHRRWQNYGYDYNPPQNPYYPDRRDYDRNQELLTQIYRMLDEISTQVRRPPPPPPPPQPIYVPYPVPYHVPQFCSCPSTVEKKPNVTSRFPEMEDPNQNWGFVLSNENTDDDDGTDGERPISFDKIKPIRPTLIPAPPVENGSSQSKTQTVTTQAPIFGGSLAKSPGICSAAILSCCGVSVDKQQRQCFSNLGCSTSFLNGEACSANSIAAALDSFKNAYQPLN